MSRMRQIPVTDVTLQERVINQNVSHPVMRPAAPNCRVRPRKVPASKFRLSDTPALISNGCSSGREFCNNVQSITVDLNNLIGSVESILPLLTTYLTALQARSMPAEQPPAATEPPIEVTAVHRPEEQPAAPTAPTAQTTAPAAPINTPPIPRPEDIQQLLENPLVKNLLNNFMHSASGSSTHNNK